MTATSTKTNLTPADRFGLSEVSVVLTAEEWMTIIARLAQKPLSKAGEEIYKRASVRMQQQMLRASNDYRRGRR